MFTLGFLITWSINFGICCAKQTIAQHPKRLHAYHTQFKIHLKYVDCKNQLSNLIALVCIVAWASPLQIYWPWKDTIPIHMGVAYFAVDVCVTHLSRPRVPIVVLNLSTWYTIRQRIAMNSWPVRVVLVIMYHCYMSFYSIKSNTASEVRFKYQNPPDTIKTMRHWTGLVMYHMRYHWSLFRAILIWQHSSFTVWIPPPMIGTRFARSTCKSVVENCNSLAHA